MDSAITLGSIGWRITDPGLCSNARCMHIQMKKMVSQQQSHSSWVCGLVSGTCETWSCEKAIGSCSAQCKMLLFCT